MKRWFISRVGDYENEDSIVPKVILYTQNMRVWSKPGVGWCFGQLAAKDLTQIAQDPDIFILPDASLDMSMSSIPAGVRTTIKNRIESAGFSYSDVKASWTVRQFLVYLQKQIQPALSSVENGDVKDLP